MQYILSKEFTKINETTGTIQNSSNVAIEMSNANTPDSGVLIHPKEKVSFSNKTIYLRGVGGYAAARVVSFLENSTGSSGSNSPGDYNDPVDDIWNNTGDPNSFDSDWDSELDSIFNP